MKIKSSIIFSLAAITMLAGHHPALGQNTELPTPYVKDGSMKAYKLAWSDEFGAAVLDVKKWDYRTDSKMLSLIHI